MNTNKRRWGILIGLMVCLLTSAATAADKITAMVSVTNAAGTTNGQTITVNGNVRTWTNAVFVSSTQILTNSTAAGAKTNMYNQFALNQFLQVVQVDAGSTNFQLIGNSGLALTVTLSAGWGSVSYSTQMVSTPTPVRVPTSVEAAAVQTNVNSALLAAIRDPSDTNVWYETDPQMVNIAGLTNIQTFSGIKKLTNAANLYQGIVSNSPAISGTVAGAGGWGLTNGVFWSPTNVNPVLSNAVNYGNAFSSPGTPTGTEQFGAAASANATRAMAIGRNSIANGVDSTAVGNGATAGSIGDIALGRSSTANGGNSTALGTGASASGPNSTALGTIAIASHSNSTAVGYSATTTADNQLMLGAPGINSVVNNYLRVLAGGTFVDGVTNLIVRGTNSFPAGSDIAFGRYALSSLGNGINDDLVVGTNVFVELSGPSAAFSTRGFAGGRDGKFLIVLNQTGQNWTVAAEGGATGNDPVAANRILTMTGADRATTGNGAATFIYSAAASRWILISFDP